MSEQTQCQRCGKTLDAEAADRLCSACAAVFDKSAPPPDLDSLGQATTAESSPRPDPQQLTECLSGPVECRSPEPEGDDKTEAFLTTPSPERPVANTQECDGRQTGDPEDRSQTGPTPPQPADRNVTA